MTDSCQNQAISPSCIGKRVCVNKFKYGTLRYYGNISTANGKWCGIELDESLGENDGMINNGRYFICKDKHGIFVPSTKVCQLPCEIDQNVTSCFSSNSVHLQKQSNKTKDSPFPFDLSIENQTDSYENLNKTFNVSLGNNDENKSSIKSQMPATILDKTLNLTTSKPDYKLEKNAFTRLDSEESLGIIPEILENSWELLDSPRVSKCANVVSEVFFPSNQNFDLTKRCMVDFNNPLQSYANDSRYTSTPKQLNNHIHLNSAFSPDKCHFLLQEGGKLDEPIIAGSNQTTLHMCFDEKEFDKGKILTSTSKLSSLLENHSPDLLTKTSVLNFKCKEISDFYNKTHMSAIKPLDDASKINDECEKLEAGTILHYTNILNGTFEVKPVYSPEGLDASPILPKNYTTINKTICVENSSEMLDDTIKNSKCETSSLEKNRTIVLNCQLNTTVSEMTENQSSNIHLNKSYVTERIDLCKASLNSKNCTSRRKSISLPIKRSVSSFKTATESANLPSDINTCIKKKELQTKQSASGRLSRRSRSAFSALQKTNSLNVDSFRKPLPVSSKLDCAQSSKLGQSISKIKDDKAKMPKKFIKAPNTTCLPKPLKTNTFGEIKRSVNSCKNSNSVEPKVKAVQPKQLSNEARFKSRMSLQSNGVKTSLDSTFIKNDSSKPLRFKKSSVKPDCKFLNSCAEVNAKNLTFSASESYDETVCNHEKVGTSGEISVDNRILIESPDNSVRETVNETNLKCQVQIQTEDVTKASSNDCFIRNDISKELSFQNKKMKSDALLNSDPEENHSLDKNLTFSASDKFYDKKDITVMKASFEKTDEIPSNYHTVQIEELSMDNCATEINNDAYLKDGAAIQALPVVDFDICNNLSSQEANITNDTFLYSCTKSNTFSKDKNQTFYGDKLCDKENATIQKEERFETTCEISSKNVNDRTIQAAELQSGKTATVIQLTKIRNSPILDALDKTFADIPNDSRIKSVSEQSNQKCKNVNSVSIKGLVKGIFSKTVNKQRVSLMPTLASRVSINLSESRDTGKSKPIENGHQGQSSISSKQNSRRSIRIPKFNLKSSAGNAKEIVRGQEKSLQIENFELNSASSGMKNNLLKTFQSDNTGKFCQGRRVLKPISVKTSTVPTVEIAKKETSDTVKLKPSQSSRIPFAAHRQIPALQSQRVR